MISRQTCWSALISWPLKTWFSIFLNKKSFLLNIKTKTIFYWMFPSISLINQLIRSNDQYLMLLKQQFPQIVAKWLTLKAIKTNFSNYQKITIYCLSFENKTIFKFMFTSLIIFYFSYKFLISLMFSLFLIETFD